MIAENNKGMPVPGPNDLTNFEKQLYALAMTNGLREGDLTTTVIDLMTLGTTLGCNYLGREKTAGMLRRMADAVINNEDQVKSAGFSSGESIN